MTNPKYYVGQILRYSSEHCRNPYYVECIGVDGNYFLVKDHDDILKLSEMTIDVLYEIVCPLDAHMIGSLDE
jgi:hypothetical protein